MNLQYSIQNTWTCKRASACFAKQLAQADEAADGAAAARWQVHSAEWKKKMNMPSKLKHARDTGILPNATDRVLDLLDCVAFSVCSAKRAQLQLSHMRQSLSDTIVDISQNHSGAP